MASLIPCYVGWRKLAALYYHSFFFTHPQRVSHRLIGGMKILT